VQIVNGLGSTRSTNGKGNLVIGYDETGVATEKGGPIKPVLQTGSHNLILGEEQWFTSYGGIVAGLENSITGPFASVTGGMANTASGGLSSVTGGGNSTASGARSSISGGAGNRAEGTNDSISGGEGNHIEGVNPLGAPTGAWIGGGLGNRISDTPGAALEFGADAAIFGGKQLSTNVNFAAIP
jgi:hypothetical protein